MSAEQRANSAADPYDILGLGFGPSNIALAIAAQELAPALTCRFLERNPSTRWHPGMLIEGARMQVSFLKDLVSLRNLSSPYTFLRYTEAKGRLERFINLGEVRPTRLEFQDYLQWVAEHFSDQVSHDSTVVRVEPLRAADGTVPAFEVTTRAGQSGHERTYRARNIVHALGGAPRVPDAVRLGGGIVHSQDFLQQFPARFDDSSHPYEFGVVGDGQSAAEITAYLLGQYPQARVHLLLPGYSLRATDNNPFLNEQYFESESDNFHRYPALRQGAVARDLRVSNYGVVEAGLLSELYDMTYADEVRGHRRLHTRRGCRVMSAQQDDCGIEVWIEDRWGGPDRTLRVDGLVLATGYQRRLDPDVYQQVLPLLVTDAGGGLVVTEDSRVQSRPEMAAGLYVQGFAESRFGIGDTLLSLLPFRSRRIVTDIGRRRAAAPPADPAPQRTYPPAHYVEHDQDRLYEVIERFSFATLLSNSPDEEYPLVTQLPLMLDRTRGAKGMLLGHLDLANPHTQLLDGRPVLALFHGPNSYISPDIFPLDQLPTWNSMTVHARGRARLRADRDMVTDQMSRICRTADPGGYTLDRDHPRIDQLLQYVIGFEIEISELIGRFKLSQELDPTSRGAVAVEMDRRARRGNGDLIERVFGVATPNPEWELTLTAGASAAMAMNDHNLMNGDLS